MLKHVRGAVQRTDKIRVPNHSKQEMFGDGTSFPEAEINLLRP